MKLKVYDGDIIKLKKNQALLITTNTEGRHGKGNALLGMKIGGAIYGKAQGPQGKCYGIITKDLRKRKHPSISKAFIMEQIQEFYEFVKKYTHVDFLIPYKGEGHNLNAYTPFDMAEMFAAFDIPENIVFERKFAELICGINEKYTL